MKTSKVDVILAFSVWLFYTYRLSKFTVFDIVLLLIINLIFNMTEKAKWQTLTKVRQLVGEIKGLFNISEKTYPAYIIV